MILGKNGVRTCGGNACIYNTSTRILWASGKRATDSKLLILRQQRHRIFSGVNNVHE